METTRLLHTILAAAATLAASAAAFSPPSPASDTLPVATRSVEISYTAHDGGESHATVLLPASYDGGPIPLRISPHGRGLPGTESAPPPWHSPRGGAPCAAAKPPASGATCRPASASPSSTPTAPAHT